MTVNGDCQLADGRAVVLHTARPGTFVISLGDAAELAHRHAARVFGAASA